jgi:hypothetical protein
MYKQYKNFKGELEGAILRTADGACIPFDPQNRDYADYLKWLEEGNEVLPADE